MLKQRAAKNTELIKAPKISALAHPKVLFLEERVDTWVGGGCGSGGAGGSGGGGRGCGDGGGCGGGVKLEELVGW